jgi:demethylmenaquinone methyltransferase/2-methoxy-6-polyprenyl-1,4-benzoquinol methylase
MTHPPFSPFGWAFRPYFHYLVPAIGGIVSGDLAAYRYLPASVDAFPAAPDLAKLMASAGFREIRYRYLALGAVAIHVARRNDFGDFAGRTTSKTARRTR